MNGIEMQKLVEVMESKNLSVTQVIELIEKTDEITLTIDYTKTIERAITDGNYDWKNGDITAKNFPISSKMIGKKVEITTKLFHFNRDINSEDATSKMDKAGYRPATLMELLVLGFLFPELQRQFPIVALGSVWRRAWDDRGVPDLSVSGSKRKRKLSLIWLGSDWGADYRFLGVRKESLVPLVS